MTRIASITSLVGLVACSAGPTALRLPAPKSIDAAGIAREADRLLDATVALDYRRPMEGQAPDRVTIRTLYWRACEAGDPRSCWMVGETMAEGLENQDQRVAANCNAGHLLSCRALQGARLSDDKMMLARECREGFARSCAQLGSHDPAVQRRTNTLLYEGCAAGLYRECEVLLDRSSIAAPIRHAALVQLCMVNQSCDRGDDPVTRAEMLERACQTTTANDACEQLVAMYASGVVAEPVSGRAQQLRRWLCAEIGRECDHEPP